MSQLSLVGGWATPLKNDGVRQLGWWNSQDMEKKTCSLNQQPVQDGAPKIAKLPYKWFNYGLL